MASRLKLQQKLIEFLGSDNVYFEPTESIQLKFPCIIYKFAGTHREYADNQLYRMLFKYSVAIVAEDAGCDELGIDVNEPIPGSSIVERFLTTFPNSSCDREFSTKDGLYHIYFELYY